MSTNDFIGNLPQDEQEAIRNKIRLCHNYLLNDGGNDDRNDNSSITHRHLREKIIISGTIASGKRDYYVITYKLQGEQVIRVSHHCRW